VSDYVSVTHEESVSTVVFNHAPMNLMNIESMAALLEAHREADANPDTRVIVMRSGIDKLFSNGIDPMAVLPADTEGRTAVFAALERLIRVLISLGKPHIAVLNGPALAGGAVLAVAADFRYFDEKAGAICFAEAKVGLPIPASIITLIRQYCAPAMLREVVLLGKHLKAPRALEAGLADGVATGPALEAMVALQVARLARLSPAVLRTTKEKLHRSLLGEIMDSESGGDFEVVTPLSARTFWSRDSTQFSKVARPYFGARTMYGRTTLP
jgi:enoyl-CoA hydratase/carnithine racemase